MWGPFLTPASCPGIFLYILYLALGCLLSPYPTLADVSFYLTLAFLVYPKYMTSVRCALPHRRVRAHASLGDRVYPKTCNYCIRLYPRLQQCVSNVYPNFQVCVNPKVVWSPEYKPRFFIACAWRV